MSRKRMYCSLAAATASWGVLLAAGGIPKTVEVVAVDGSGVVLAQAVIAVQTEAGPMKAHPLGGGICVIKTEQSKLTLELGTEGTGRVVELTLPELETVHVVLHVTPTGATAKFVEGSLAESLGLAQPGAARRLSTSPLNPPQPLAAAGTARFSAVAAGALLVGGADNCVDAEPLLGGGTFAFNNLTATTDGVATATCGQIYKDVWFCYQATATGNVTVETCGGTGLDTKIAAYLLCECPVPATTLACNDDACSLQSRITFAATENDTYLIRIGNYSSSSSAGAAGTFTITEPTPPPPPPCTQPPTNCQARDLSDARNSNRSNFIVADDFTPAADGAVSEVCWWGVYYDGVGDCAGIAPDTFVINYYADSAGVPGALLASFSQAGGTLAVTGPAPTGETLIGIVPVYEYKGVHAAVPVTGGDCYWIEISNQLSGCTWFWLVSAEGNGRAMQDGDPPNGYSLPDADAFDVAFCIDLALGDPGACVPPPPTTPCEQPPTNCQGQNIADAFNSTRTAFITADDFTTLDSGAISEICWWGAYYDGAGDCAGVVADDFEVRYYANAGGVPGALLASFSQLGGTLVVTGPAPTGDLIAELIPEYEYTATHAPVPVVAGECYWIEITNDLQGVCTWFWEISFPGNAWCMQDGTPPDGYTSADGVFGDLAFCLNLALGDAAPCRPPPPPNDECLSAAELSCNGSVVADNTFATDDPSDPAFSCSPGGVGSLWYTFVATHDSAMISTCHTATGDTVLAVYDGTCESLVEIACAEDECSLRSEVCATGLTIGNTYYVQFGSYGESSRGSYLLDLYCPCPAPPPNDHCVDAIGPLAVPSTTPGTTERADIDSTTPTCVTSITSPGVWYTVIGTGTTMTADLCNGATAFDSKLSVYCGGCETLTCVDGNDEFCGAQSSVTWCSQLGAEYLILVHGYGGASGPFELVLSDDGVPCTATVACLPTGACCLEDGCTVLTQAECEALGGYYAGDDVPCGGPAGYALTDCGNTLENIAATGTPGPTGDDSSVLAPLGFTFKFYGTDHTDILMSTNGYLTFGSVGGDFSNDPIPNTADPDDLIAALWDDLIVDGIGETDYATLGVAPNRRFVAQWTNVRQLGNSDANTFQIVLYEGSNVIELRYATITPESPAGDYTIGIENQDGSDGINVAGASVASGDCLHFENVVAPDPCLVEGEMDFKPGVCPNPFYRKTGLVVMVAALGETDFDVSLIDVSTVRLARADGVGGPVAPLNGPPGPGPMYVDVGTPFPGEPCDCHDLNGDGLTDLKLPFDVGAVVTALGLNALPDGTELELVLTATLTNGLTWRAGDCVVLVPPAPRPLNVGSSVAATPIRVTPADEEQNADGFADFQRSYVEGMPITLTAPAVSQGRVFAGWEIDGVRLPADQLSVDLLASPDLTAYATYGRPVRTQGGAGRP